MSRPRSWNIRALGISAAVSVGASLGLFAAPALAAPANDHFSERAQIAPTLPVSVTGSNEGATRDPGEYPGLLNFGKGHTVWWEWESPTTGFVTASTCQSNFYTVLGVFEGTEVEHLTPLTEGNADEYPGCQASGEAYVFRAVAGGHYVVGVDGNGFYAPPGPGEEPHVPSGEGQITLTLEPTPIPPNDAFENAAPLPGLQQGPESPFEPPTDDRYFRGGVHGYNWGATKQPGEPDHAGNPGGASVWYSLTPRESGELWLSVPTYGGVDGTLLALYEGSTLATLRPIGAGSGSFASVRAPVTAGTEYRIAVDGKRSEMTGEPHLSAFSLQVEMKLPPLPAAPAPAAAQPAPTTPAPKTATPPRTTVTGRKVDAGTRSAVITFASTPGAKFSCRLDSGRSRPCTSPDRLRRLDPGKHRFEVVAHDGAGSDPTPAIVHFSVPAPHRHHHRSG